MELIFQRRAASTVSLVAIWNSIAGQYKHRKVLTEVSGQAWKLASTYSLEFLKMRKSFGEE